MNPLRGINFRIHSHNPIQSHHRLGFYTSIETPIFSKQLDMLPLSCFIPPSVVVKTNRFFC